MAALCLASACGDDGNATTGFTTAPTTVATNTSSPATDPNATSAPNDATTDTPTTGLSTTTTDATDAMDTTVDPTAHTTTGMDTTGSDPMCGDGMIDPGETCDDGPANGPGQPCNAMCAANACGDGDQGP
ncbi:MAG TPA: hypothetical protein VGB85_12945, partial [Nannocystis sp.]